MPRFVCTLLAALALRGALFADAARAEESPAASIAEARAIDRAPERRLTGVVQPFLKSYCVACHGEKKREAKLDLSRNVSAKAVAKNHRLWDTVRDRLEAEEMPPATAREQPTAHERRAVIESIEAFFEDEARRNAGDPGEVLARRLSNAEFDYTIRDLTGVDIGPTREFPVDPANEAGFDNSGESLAMSPALLKKYLAAARLVADHLVLKPQGFVFAPHPAVTETDRDKYCVQRIMAFYERHRVDYADYFLAAWKHRHRETLGQPQTSLGELAAAEGLSAKYLETIWTTLTGPEVAAGPLGEVQTVWRALPVLRADDVAGRGEVRRACEGLRDLVVKLRSALEPPAPRLHVDGISDGSQPFVLWRNRQRAALHRRYAAAAKADDPADPDLDAARRRFCEVFPDAFQVTDRGGYFDPKGAGQGRLLTAGFHLMQGYFRDDGPLCELVLDEQERRALDGLWQELDFVTRVPERQYKDFIFFERAEPPRFMKEAEFDFARSEDKASITPAKMQQLAEAYLAKARRLDAPGEALEAIETYFKTMSADIRRVEDARRTAEPGHLEALVAFAARAARRPLPADERRELLAFYRASRETQGLGHEEALRDSVASVLLSPHFCYRLDEAEPREGARTLSGYSLASRLSYFLWSSMPDDELLAHAAAGDLNRPDVLVAEARRMLRDGRVRGLAVEFAGNWLDFRRFEEHNAVDRARFAGFTNELRHAMFEEPVRFVVDAVSQNRSVLEFLDADHTFVNPLLATHYGIDLPEGAAEKGPGRWARVDKAHRFGRGGLLPMAVFLTRNSPGLRTSPVKRGYWVVRRLLGEQIPAPPPEVPELPQDEAASGELTLPQLLARHREHKACGACHQRFDALGLAFEGYGPIGELRDNDLGGRPVETGALFPDGSRGTGLGGLRHYLSSRRQNDFVENLCRKLLSYALGRSLVPSDKSTLASMRARLAADGHRFHGLVETIVTSPQFLNKRENSVAEDVE